MSDQSDNNRSIQANPTSGEGTYEAHLDFKNARQSLPDPDLHNDGTYDTASTVSGEKELLGQGTSGEGMKDDHYPSVANPSNPKFDVDFGSVAPYRNGEFPRDSLPKTGIKATLPLV